MFETTLLLCALRTYFTLTSIANGIGSFAYKVYRVFSEDSNPTYIFFENIMHPYLASVINPIPISSAIPEWSYKPDTKTFQQWSFSSSYPRLRSTILSMEIIENDTVIYDLTDFLESLTIRGSIMPSVEHIVGAWYLYSGIVLDTTTRFVVRHITEQADTVLTPLPYIQGNPEYTYDYAADAADAAADADAADADAADADAAADAPAETESKED